MDDHSEGFVASVLHVLGRFFPMCGQSGVIRDPVQKETPMSGVKRSLLCGLQENLGPRERLSVHDLTSCMSSFYATPGMMVNECHCVYTDITDYSPRKKSRVKKLIR